MDKIENICCSVRADIAMLEESVKEIKDHPELDESDIDQLSKSEIRGNAMLAYRHLEDAKLRLGQVLAHIERGRYPTLQREFGN